MWFDVLIQIIFLLNIAFCPFWQVNHFIIVKAGRHLVQELGNVSSMTVGDTICNYYIIVIIKLKGK
jgi:hypothetical protein